jgi:putative nucleotidyltransferase with HDIG domain
MVAVWSRLTLLQRFTAASTAIAVGLAIGLSVVAVRAIQAFTIKDEAQIAAELVLRTFSPQLRAQDFQGAFPDKRRALLDSLFRAHGISDKILRVRLWRTDGRLLYSNTREPEERGTSPANLSTAEGYRRFVMARQGVDNGTPGAALAFVPVRVAGSPRTLGAFEIFYDWTLLNQRLTFVRRTIWTSVPLGLFFLYASVFVLVRRASRQLLKQQRDLIEAHLGTYNALAGAIDAKDSYTGDHSTNVAQLAVEVGRVLGLKEEALEEIRMAARLHDLGKIGVPDAILMKPGPLTPEEWMIMRKHAEAGFEILKAAPLSSEVKRAVLHSHEWWDGGGYPERLAGEAIPLASRIVAVVDAFEAMTGDRPYRKGLPREEALRRLHAGAGTQFDPDIVRIFVLLRGATAMHASAPLAASAPHPLAVSSLPPTPPGPQRAHG